ncbi:MAG TPA: PIN domain-containing protein [Candidatus Binatia bacterium]
MSIREEWIVLDTNIWIFGLRRVPEFPACAELLDHLNRLRVVLPRQILQELQANLVEDELRALFRVLNRLPISPKIDWQKASAETVAKYQQMGCKLGDAVVSAHLEELGVKVLVTENRDFLEELTGLPFRRINAIQAMAELSIQHS